jgi:hypothetical protein
MPELNVDLITPAGMVLEATRLPDDMLTEEVISELVDELGLPRLSPDGEPLLYAIEVEGQDGSLSAGLSLRDLGVSNGDRLRLRNDAPEGTPAPRAKGAGAGAEAGAGDDAAIEVVLSVLDLNKSEKTALRVDRPVGELVQQIVGSFNLPARDKLGELIVYRLESKALGRYLANRETLHQAGVPRLDRVTVHREELAGAVSFARRPSGERRAADHGRRAS